MQTTASSLVQVFLAGFLTAGLWLLQPTPAAADEGLLRELTNAVESARETTASLETTVATEAEASKDIVDPVPSSKVDTSSQSEPLIDATLPATAQIIDRTLESADASVTDALNDAGDTVNDALASANEAAQVVVSSGVGDVPSVAIQGPVDSAGETVESRLAEADQTVDTTLESTQILVDDVLETTSAVAGNASKSVEGEAGAGIDSDVSTAGAVEGLPKPGAASDPTAATTTARTTPIQARDSQNIRDSRAQPPPTRFQSEAAAPEPAPSAMVREQEAAETRELSIDHANAERRPRVGIDFWRAAATFATASSEASIEALSESPSVSEDPSLPALAGEVRIVEETLERDGNPATAREIANIVYSDFWSYVWMLAFIGSGLALTVGWVLARNRMG